MSKSPVFEELLKKYGAETIIDRLAPFLTENRQERIIPVLDHRLGSIQVAVENPTDVHNSLAVVRTAEALGMLHTHLIGHPQKKKGRQTMRGSDRWVNLYRYETFSAFNTEIKKNGIKLYGATPRGTIPMEAVPVYQPCCFLFGNEAIGLTDEALNACDLHYQIPMYGFCESYNLSVSAAITLYDATRRKRKTLTSLGDLSEEEKTLEKAWFFIKSAGSELATKILSR